jgi:hypothetical protein
MMGYRSCHNLMGTVLVAFVAFLPVGAQAAVILTLERTSETYRNGDPMWLLKLMDGPKRLASWTAAAGASNRQRLDRRWSPGNGSPLPPGSYRLGSPEPLGQDLWIDLQPQFATSRSELGIHNCFPGVGCICIPDRKSLNSLAEAIRRWQIRSLKVIH